MADSFHIGDVIVPRYTGAFVIDHVFTNREGQPWRYKLRELGTDFYVIVAAACITDFRVALPAGATPFVHRAE